jgi:hypothetical protein
MMLPQGCDWNRDVMRSLLAALLGAIACLAATNSASAMTSGELMRSCGEIVDRVRPKTGSEVNIPLTGLSCWYYLSAIQNMSVLETQQGVRLLGICAPPDTTLMDYVRIFAARARKTRNQHENAAAFAVIVLGQSFPCDGKAPHR